MGRSDSRPRPPRGYGFPRGVAPTGAPRRVSQDPHSFCRHAPSPLTPGSLMRADARCFRISCRLHHRRQTGRCHWLHEAESGSHTLGSRLRPRSLLATRPAPPDRPVSRSWLPDSAGPGLHGERAIHMADTSQSARKSRVTLAQPTTRRDDDTTRPAMTGVTGGIRSIDVKTGALRPARDETVRLLSTALPRWRRAGRQAGVAGVRVERIASGQSDKPAVCDSLDSHSCHRAKRGAASGQNPSK